MGRVKGTVLLPPELHRKLKILAVELSEKPRELDLNDLYIAGVKLLLEILEDPSIISIDRIRDGELRGFLSRLLERRERAAALVA